MADRAQPHQLQVHPQRRYGQETDIKQGSQGPSASKVLAVLTLLPIGGTLLTISCITLAGTLIGLALSFPLFIIFSPVLVPATIVIGLAVAAILTSGVFGLTALSSLSWLVKYLRQVTGFTGEYKEEAKRKMQEMAEYVGQKMKDVGQEIQTKPQDQGRRT